MAEFIEQLCNINGVSGDEGKVREFIRNNIEKYADEVTVDSMGNLIVLKKGKKSTKKVMLSAHMDEVGFIISGFSEKGYLEFKKVGGIDNRVIISKKVYVGDKKIPGVIGMKAVHLQKPAERNSIPEAKNLYIDIGAKSKSEAMKKVELGDYAAFSTVAERYGTESLKAKAIDDRAGCAVLMEMIKKDVKYDTYFCFLVQEEVGLRGARIAVERINPDIALVLEATTCSDVHGCKEHEYATKLGGGAVISLRDRASIADEAYREKMVKLAEEKNIPYQFKRTATGGNDAGAIHISGGGVKTLSISVPCRYLHSPAGVASLKDIKAAENLVAEYLDNIDMFLD